MEPDRSRQAEKDDTEGFAELQASFHLPLHAAQELQWHMLNKSDNNDRQQVTEETTRVDSLE